MPQMQPVDSSNIAAIGHEGDELHVQFNNGTTFCYTGVPAGVFADMVSAQSQGKFFNERIKNTYTGERV